MKNKINTRLRKAFGQNVAILQHSKYKHYYKRAFLRRRIYIGYKGTDVVNDTVAFL